MPVPYNILRSFPPGTDVENTLRQMLTEREIGDRSRRPEREGALPNRQIVRPALAGLQSLLRRT